MTYPNRRILNINYGPSGAMNDMLSRIAFLIDNDGVTQLVDYTYLGRDQTVQTNSPQPGLEKTLIGLDTSVDPVTGDIYKGLDLFARIKDLIWLGTGPNSSSSSSGSSGGFNILERTQHGYDRAGNRLYRVNLADPTELHDELYDYDGINRLKDMARGTINLSRSALLAKTFAQCWALDEAGNWGNFREDDTGSGTWNLVQNRAFTPANEISVVNNLVGSPWVTPAY